MRFSEMRPTVALAFGLGLLAGCEEASVITHVDKLSHMHMRDLVTMQEANGIATEIHGSAFPGVDAETLAAVLRPPQGSAQVVRFFAVPPGRAADTHGGYRLVLHFNPSGPPNAVNDCRRTALAATLPPRDKGFEVNATFCKGDEWQAHGFLKAPGVEAGELERYSQEIRALFLNILREEKDR